MKRIGWLVFMLAAAGPGCLGFGSTGEGPGKSAPLAEVRPRPAPVLPDDVDEKNAREKAKKLGEEIEGDLAPPAPPAAAPKR
jgi:hypothetical protein